MVFENLDDFDSVVLLTQRQRDDVVAQLGPHRNLAVVPNSRELGPVAPLQRPRGRGMVLATLDDRKRVDQAVLAVIAAAGKSAGVTLDVFGDGERRNAIERLVRERSGDGIVRLNGYRADARHYLRDASFLLLTSKFEGFPLVLLESMAAGCLPIAYDIPYGPSDIIRHGENGFLVGAGDHGAVAEAILHLLSLPEEQVAVLRTNARRTAVQYSDEAVVSMWARVLHNASMHKRVPPLLPARARVVVQSARMVVGHGDPSRFVTRARRSAKASATASRRGPGAGHA